MTSTASRGLPGPAPPAAGAAVTVPRTISWRSVQGRRGRRDLRAEAGRDECGEKECGGGRTLASIGAPGRMSNARWTQACRGEFPRKPFTVACVQQCWTLPTPLGAVAKCLTLRPPFEQPCVAAVVLVGSASVGSAQAARASAPQAKHASICAQGVKVYTDRAQIPVPFDTLDIPAPDGPVRVTNEQEAEAAELAMRGRAGSSEQRASS